MSSGFIYELRGASWRNALKDLCRTWLQSTAVMAEIGCYAGESTLVFARHCREVIAVDPWRDSFRRKITWGCSSSLMRQDLIKHPPPPMNHIRLLYNKRLRNCDNVKTLAMGSAQAARLVTDRTLDFVYIDSIHTFRHVCRDIELWLPKIRPNGIIGGHDYSPEEWPGVVKAVKVKLGFPDEVFADTSWVKRLTV